MAPNIIQFSPTQWIYRSALLIHEAVINAICKNKRCSVMLTGGRSAEKIYHIWAGFQEFEQFSGIDFYFTDERWVPLNDIDNNCNMTLKSLFKAGVPEGCNLYRVETNLSNASSAAFHYGKNLPDIIDVMILGVGEDGHIASLFPNNFSLEEQESKVISTIGSKPPSQRITITRRVLNNAKTKIVLAPGIEKAKVLQAALKDKANYKAVPVRLVFDSTWLVDQLVEH
jgi:6-phosphogluconolactonase